MIREKSCRNVQKNLLQRVSNCTGVEDHLFLECKFKKKVNSLLKPN